MSRDQAFKEVNIKSAELHTGTIVSIEPVLPLNAEDLKNIKYSVQIEHKNKPTINILLTKSDLVAIKEAVGAVLESKRF